MASLVLGVVGGMIAGPFGFAVGSYLGGMLFSNAPDRHTEGPRLQDLKVQSSAYGAPIPIVYGRSRIAGNVIWSDGITERVHETSSGGKGGDEVTSTSYTYDINVAISMCAGPIVGVARIWADAKLIYDATVNPIVIDGSIGDLTVHNGTETQLEDSLIAGIEGIAPAYRGIAYVVFGTFQLAKFGNRIPNFTFEVTTAGDAGVVAPTTLVPEYATSSMGDYSDHHWQCNTSFPYEHLTSGVDPFQGGSLAIISPGHGIVSMRRDSSHYSMPFLTELKWQVFEPRNMSSINGSTLCHLEGPNTSMLMFGSTIISMYDTAWGVIKTPNYFWYGYSPGKTFVDGAYTYFPISVVDVFHNISPGYHYIKIPTKTGYSSPGDLIGIYNVRSDEDAYIRATTSRFNPNWTLLWNTDTTYSSPINHDFDPSFWGGGGNAVESRSAGIRGIWHAPDGKSYFFGRYEVIQGPSPTNTNIVVMSTNGPADYVQTDRVGYGQNDLGMAKLITVLDDRDQLYITDPVTPSQPDEYQGGHLFDIIYDGEAAVRFCFRAATAIRDPSNDDAKGAALLGNGTLVQTSNNSAVWWSSWFWDSIMWYAYVHEIPLMGQSISTDPVNLKDIVDDIEERVDVTTSLRDNTDLATYTVDGYTLTKTMSGRAAIEPLALAYQFDVIESEGLLESVKRGDF